MSGLDLMKTIKNKKSALLRNSVHPTCKNCRLFNWSTFMVIANENYLCGAKWTVVSIKMS